MDAVAPTSFDPDAFLASSQQGGAPPPTETPGSTPEAGFDPDAYLQAADQQKYGSPEQGVIAGIEGAAHGALGPIATGFESAIGVPAEDIAGRASAHPIVHTATEVGGLGAGLMTGTGIGGLATTAGEAAEAAAGLGEASRLAATGSSAVRQAAEMAVLQGSDEASKMIVQDPSTSAGSAIANVGLAAALGGAGGAVFTGAISPLWKATLGGPLDSALSSIASHTESGINDAAEQATGAPWIMKKVLSTFGGVSEDDIDAYLQNHKDIQNLPEFQDVYDKTHQHVADIFDAVDSGKKSVEQASEAFKDLHQDAVATFRQQGYDASVADGLARQTLRDAQTKLASDIQDQALNTAKPISDAVENLRQSVIDQSGKAYDVLDDSDAKVNLQGFFGKAEDLAKDLESQGTIESRAQAARIRQYSQGVLDQFGQTEISGSDAKGLIQGLDKVSKYDFNAAAFDKGLSPVYKQLRYDLDDTLKSAVPEYKKAMAPLAKDTSLLSNLTSYGTPEAATSRLKSIKNPDRFKSDIPLLQKLEKATGSKFLQDIQPYANPDIRDALMKSLPEYGEAQKTADALTTLKDPATKQALLESLQRSPEAQAKAAAESQLEKAQAAKEEIKGVTPQNLQAKLEAAGRNKKNIANLEVLRKLPGFEGKDLPELMDLMRVRDAFSKDATRGSRNVNLFGAMMGGIGSLMGHLPFGVSTGAAIGGAVDKYGPSMVGKLLDKYATRYGNLQELAKEGNKRSVGLMLNRILGHTGESSAEGFKSGVNYLHNALGGYDTMNKSAKAIFSTGINGTISHFAVPTAESLAKLDKMVADRQSQPSEQVAASNASELGHYLPDHQAAVTQTSLQALQYLQKVRPAPYQPSPLDRPIEPSSADKANYNRALTIAQQPTVVMQHIKDGTLQAADIQHLQAMYPALYPGMQQLVTNAMMSHKADEAPVPYKTRVGVSLFMQQPMDTSMQPTSIQAAQPQQPPTPTPTGKKGKGSPSKLGKTNKSYMTPNQAAESDRGDRSGD